MKLYWRVKINGKWTWRAAKVKTLQNNRMLIVAQVMKPELEE